MDLGIRVSSSVFGDLGFRFQGFLENYTGLLRFLKVFVGCRAPKV